MADNSMHLGGDRLIARDRDNEGALDYEDQSEYDELKRNSSVEMECYQTMNICCGSCSGCLRAWLPCFFCCLGKNSKGQGARGEGGSWKYLILLCALNNNKSFFL